FSSGFPARQPLSFLLPNTRAGLFLVNGSQVRVLPRVLPSCRLLRFSDEIAASLSRLRLISTFRAAVTATQSIREVTNDERRTARRGAGLLRPCHPSVRTDTAG